MFSSESDVSSVQRAIQLVHLQNSQPGRFTCPYCNLSNLSEDSLWHHCPLYHIQERNDLRITCPICGARCEPDRDPPFQVHLRNKHGPCGRGELQCEDDHNADELFAFALVVCVRSSDGKMLLVHEFASTGMWLPGGRLDREEKLEDAAVRETKEEAGVDVQLTGILKLQFSPHRGYVRLRCVFMAKPVDETIAPKSLPDYESAGAVWADLNDIISGKFPLRGSEPQIWAKYLLAGGKIHDLQLLTGREQ